MTITTTHRGETARDQYASVQTEQATERETIRRLGLAQIRADRKAGTR